MTERPFSHKSLARRAAGKNRSWARSVPMKRPVTCQTTMWLTSVAGRLPRRAWSVIRAETGSMRMTSRSVPTPLTTRLRVVAVRASSGANRGAGRPGSPDAPCSPRPSPAAEPEGVSHAAGQADDIEQRPGQRQPPRARPGNARGVGGRVQAVNHPGQQQDDEQVRHCGRMTREPSAAQAAISSAPLLTR